MNTASRPFSTPAPSSTTRVRFAAVTLAALMTLGTLSSVHGLSVIDMHAATLAHAQTGAPQA